MKKLLEGAGPALRGPKPGSRAGSTIALNAQIDEIAGEAKCSPDSRELIRATVLLWHDHLDAAHAIVQNIENADGSYLHAILHRREPDYGNAKYWFHRVGKHPCFPELARRATSILQGKREDTLLTELVPGGEWDPFAFVDACERAASRPDSDPQTQLLREIQAAEFELVLERVSNG